MFAFRFDAVLLKLTRNTPAVEPLPQLPPEYRLLPYIAYLLPFGWGLARADDSDVSALP
ncbi:hypothetical protein HMPREF1022_02931 [Desulfovibrio sp. 6_1_46AFAA]|nr:hypothetical protein HMPREF1022_02931 [Desulfovibrio sp. 6_1_46AFAA]